MVMKPFDIDEIEAGLIVGLADPQQVARWKDEAAEFDRLPAWFLDMVSDAFRRTMDQAARDGLVKRISGNECP